MVVVSARTQHRLIDQLFSVPKYVRPAKMSDRFFECLTKIRWTVPERSRDDLKEIVGQYFVKMSDGNVSDFQKKKASGAMANHFPKNYEKYETHQVMVET